MPKPVPSLAAGLAASYILGMYPARQQKNDERRPGDLEAENLKAELKELKDKHAEKNQMFAELNEINIRLEGKLPKGRTERAEGRDGASARGDTGARKGSQPEGAGQR